MRIPDGRPSWAKSRSYSRLNASSSCRRGSIVAADEKEMVMSMWRVFLELFVLAVSLTIVMKSASSIAPCGSVDIVTTAPDDVGDSLSTSTLRRLAASTVPSVRCLFLPSPLVRTYYYLSIIALAKLVLEWDY